MAKITEKESMKGKSPLIPWYITDKIAAIPGTRLDLPLQFKEKVGVLFTDICSFTNLTDHFSSSGHYGVEGLTSVLERYFTVMIDCIHKNGGSLIKFGGDSTLSVFPGEEKDVKRRMYSCKNDMYTALELLNKDFKNEYDISVNFRGGGSYDEIITNIVGNQMYHLDYYFVGKGMTKAFKKEENSLPGEISFTFKEPEPAELSGYSAISMSEGQKRAIERQFISQTILHRVKQQRKFRAELKNAAIIFINLINKESDSYINYKHYHQLFQSIQEIVYGLDGNINKIDLNEKGYLILITFGVPNIHNDDIERAFVCSYRLSQLSSDYIGLRIGITYSNIFAGVFGSINRCEYGILGNGVNVAARLMDSAECGEITFSREILPRISSRFETEFIGETFVKGFKKAINIYKMIGEFPENWVALSHIYKDRELIAYQSEMEEAVKTLSGEKFCILQLTGKSGVGKTFLIFNILSRLKEASVDFVVLEEFNLVGKLDLINKILKKKLFIESMEKDYHKIKELCQQHDIQYDEKLFLEQIRGDVNFVLLTPQEQQQRNDIFCSVMQEILVAVFAETDILIIDNFQWLDPLSRRILINSLPLMREKGLKIIIASHFLEDIPRISRSEFKLIKMENLSLEDAEKLIQKELKNITVAAIRLIHTLTGGNPFFIVELIKIVKKNFNYKQDILTDSEVYNLQRSGIIPATIENIFLQQFENLDENSKYLLKIASIVGSSFSINELMVTDKKQIKDDLVDLLMLLNDNQIIDQRTINPNIEYIFSNSFMREAIYRTILMSEKRELHEKIARYYEGKYADNSYHYTEIIANHYLQTNNIRKKLLYCRKAAEKNKVLYFLDESYHYYDQASKFKINKKTKAELELNKIDIMLLQGRIAEADARLKYCTAEFDDLLNIGKNSKLTSLQEFLIFLKMKMKVYTADYVGVKELRSRYQQEFQSPLYKDAIELYTLDALRFLNEKEAFDKKAKVLLEQFKEEKNYMHLASLYSVMGQFYLDKSEYLEAMRLFKEKLKTAERIDNLFQIRQALNSIGVSYSRVGRKDKAFEFYEKAIDIAEKLGDRNGLSKGLLNLGTLYRNQAAYEKAMECYDKSLRLTKLTLNKELEAIIIYNIGELYYHFQGDTKKAMPYFTQSLEIAAEINDKVQITFCNDAIGDMTFSAGKIDQAEEIYTRNLEIQRELNDIEGIAHTYGNLGNIAKARKDYKTAISYYQQQQHLLSENGDKDGEGRAWFNLAMVDLEMGFKELARTKLEKALKLFEDCSAQYYIDITRQQIDGLKT